MFSASEKSIYRYSNGEREVCGDPLALRRKFVAALAGEDVDRLLTDADGPLDVANPALDKILPAIRSAFRLKELDDDGTGLPEAETLGVLADFFRWESAKKGSGDPGLAGSPSTDSPPDSPSITTPGTASS